LVPSPCQCRQAKESYVTVDGAVIFHGDIVVYGIDLNLPRDFAGVVNDVRSANGDHNTSSAADNRSGVVELRGTSQADAVPAPRRSRRNSREGGIILGKCDAHCSSDD
jgi:hypothetical protein